MPAIHSVVYYYTLPMHIVQILTDIFIPISVFFCYKSLNLFLTPKKGVFYFLLRLAGSSLLCGMVIYIGDLINFIPTLLIFTITTCLCYEHSLWQNLTTACMFSSLGLSFSALTAELMPIELWNPVKGLGWLLLFLSIRRYHSREDYQLSDSLWKLLLFLTATPLGIVITLISMLPISVEETGDVLLCRFYEMVVRPTVYILLFFAILSFYGLLRSIKILARQYRLEQDQILYEMNRQYYGQLEQNQFEVRKLRHDMVHHLQALTLLSDDARTDYLNDLLEHPSLKYSTGFCQNQVVNAVINAKMSRIKAASIDFHCKLSIPEDIPMEKIDLCTLFANCLDNAIDACEKFSPLLSHLRTISLESRYDRGIFLLQCKNPLPDSLLTEDGKIITSKKDRNMHGIGIPSIKEVAKRYHGTVEPVVSDGEFILLVNIILS